MTVARSYRRMTPSVLPAARVRPSGEKAKTVTWPRFGSGKRPSSRSTWFAHDDGSFRCREVTTVRRQDVAVATPLHIKHAQFMACHRLAKQTSGVKTPGGCLVSGSIQPSISALPSGPENKRIDASGSSFERAVADATRRRWPCRERPPLTTSADVTNVRPSRSKTLSFHSRQTRVSFPVFASTRWPTFRPQASNRPFGLSVNDAGRSRLPGCWASSGRLWCSRDAKTHPCPL